MAIATVDPDKLRPHIGHEIELATYGDADNPVSITIECMDCYEVLVDTFEDVALPEPHYIGQEDA